MTDMIRLDKTQNLWDVEALFSWRCAGSVYIWRICVFGRVLGGILSMVLVLMIFLKFYSIRGLRIPMYRLGIRAFRRVILGLLWLQHRDTSGCAW